ESRCPSRWRCVARTSELSLRAGARCSPDPRRHSRTTRSFRKIRAPRRVHACPSHPEIPRSIAMSYRFDTRAIHAGQPDDPSTGAIAVPVYQTSTFAQREPGVHQGYAYGRSENPTRAALEANLAALEDARFGLAFASGLAAVHNVLTLLEAGDHVVSCADLYGGSYRLFT